MTCFTLTILHFQYISISDRHLWLICLPIFDDKNLLHEITIFERAFVLSCLSCFSNLNIGKLLVVHLSIFLQHTSLFTNWPFLSKRLLRYSILALRTTLFQKYRSNANVSRLTSKLLESDFYAANWSVTSMKLFFIKFVAIAILNFLWKYLWSSWECHQLGKSNITPKGTRVFTEWNGRL